MNSKFPSKRQRITVAVAIATLAAIIPWYMIAVARVTVSDFSQMHYSARLLLFGGGDPYKLVPVVVTGFPFFYPLTAVVLTLPLGFLSELNASLVFAWVSAFTLVFAVTKKGWHLLPIVLSVPFLIVIARGQWSALLAAGFMIPSLGVLFSAKPSVGFALMAAHPSRRVIISAVGGGLLLAVIGLLYLPRWPLEWLESLRASGVQQIPIAHPAGVIAALALVRWRRPEARLIFLLACVPQTLSWYETLPLLLVAATFRESLLLSLASFLPILVEAWAGQGRFYPANIAALMLFAYVPPLILVLRRPNVGLDVALDAPLQGTPVPAMK
jgi:hypothetical protein